MGARTLDQCERAETLMREWLLLVGDDRGVRIYGAGLQRMHDARLRTADPTSPECVARRVWDPVDRVEAPSVRPD